MFEVVYLYYIIYINITQWGCFA